MIPGFIRLTKETGESRLYATRTIARICEPGCDDENQNTIMIVDVRTKDGKPCQREIRILETLDNIQRRLGAV